LISLCERVRQWSRIQTIAGPMSSGITGRRLLIDRAAANIHYLICGVSNENQGVGMAQAEIEWAAG